MDISTSGFQEYFQHFWKQKGNVRLQFRNYGSQLSSVKMLDFCIAPGFLHPSLLLVLWYPGYFMSYSWLVKHTGTYRIFLVGGWTTHPKNIRQNMSKWESSPNRGENNKCLKPPPRFTTSAYIAGFCTPLYERSTNPHSPAWTQHSGEPFGPSFSGEIPWVFLWQNGVGSGFTTVDGSEIPNNHLEWC